MKTHFIEAYYNGQLMRFSANGWFMFTARHRARRMQRRFEKRIGL